MKHKYISIFSTLLLMAPVVGQGVSVSAQGTTDETTNVITDTTVIENKVLSPLGESSKEAPQELANGVSEESLPKADATLGSVAELENVTSPITSSSKMITGTLSTEEELKPPKLLRDGEIDYGTYGTAPWMLDFEGVLHIRAGEFDEDSAPWKERADLIEKIVFEGTVIACENSNGLFSDLPRLTEIDGLDKLDVSRVTSMRDMFSGDRNLTTLDVSKWDTSKVTDMNTMFQCASSLTTLDVSEWNTANVKDMSFMFDNATRLTTLDVSKWYTANVENMTAMFRYDNSLTTLDVRNWNTVSVTRLESMLFASNMRSITLGPNSKFRRDVNLVGPNENDSYTGKWKYESDLEGHAPETPLSLTTEELMSTHYETKPGTYVWETKDPVAGADVTVYYEDDKGSKISEDVVLKGNVGDDYTSEQKALPGYTFSKVEGAATGKFTDTAQTVKYVYMKDKEVPSAPDDIDSGVYGTAPWRLDGDGTLHISAGAFNEDAVPWKNHAEIIKKIVFEGTVIAYEDSNGLFSDLPQVTEINGLDKLDVSSVTSMRAMFSKDTNLTTLDVSKWDTSKVTTMYAMFSGASSLTTLDVSGWNTANVISMSFMFDKANSLTTLDVSGWNTANVKDMTAMFLGASSLTTLDVSGWNTANVTDMNTMFKGASSLTTLDVSKWNTSKVTTMYAMFNGASSLTTLDVSGWNTANVISMSFMFDKVNSLTTLDVSGWNTANVKDMTAMFLGASSLTTLDVSGWNTANVTDMNTMFYGASSLITLDVSKWDTSKVTTMYAMFYNAYKLRSITLGPNFKFMESAHLVSPEENDSYTGKWKYESDLEGHAPETPLSLTAKEFMSTYDGTKPGTYSWEMK